MQNEPAFDRPDAQPGRLSLRKTQSADHQQSNPCSMPSGRGSNLERRLSLHKKISMWTDFLVGTGSPLTRQLRREAMTLTPDDFGCIVLGVEGEPVQLTSPIEALHSV